MDKKQTLKRFNSSNGIRLLNQQNENAEEEEKDDKFISSFINSGPEFTITHNREVVIKAKDDLDVENDMTKATNNIDSGRHLHFRPYTDSLNERPERMKKNGYYFRFPATDVKIIRYTLEDNGFRENNNPRNQDWLIMWST